jgi:hypothetical protein
MPPFSVDILIKGQTLCHGIDEPSADLSMRLCFKVESQRAAEDVYVEKKGQLREVFSERVRYFMRTCRRFTDCHNGYRGPFKTFKVQGHKQNINRESRSNMKNVGHQSGKSRNA